MSVFEEALEASRPSVTPEMETEYERMHEKLKQENPGGRRQLGFTTAEPGEE